MAGRAVRWVLAAMMLASLALFLSSPALAEVTPLPMEITAIGRPPKADGYLSETEYLDESIHAVVTTPTYQDVLCHVIDVTIADPSQIRTALSYDSPRGHEYAWAATMAEHVNAIAAVNGDFFKYHFDVSYVVRQGVEYFPPEELYGKRDVLVIDDQGDFWGVQRATADKVHALLDETLPEGRQVVNAFTFGPVLVENGEVQTFTNDEFQPEKKMQRAAIVQVDKLTYAIVECDGMSDGTYGLTMVEFAEFIQSLYPQCRLAFNLDGGGSTNVVFHNERIHVTSGIRKIGDIIYFASAAGEE